MSNSKSIFAASSCFVMIQQIRFMGQVLKNEENEAIIYSKKVYKNKSLFLFFRYIYDRKNKLYLTRVGNTIYRM